MTVAFQLAGQPCTALNGGPEYKFTDAVSRAMLTMRKIVFRGCATISPCPAPDPGKQGRRETR